MRATKTCPYLAFGLVEYRLQRYLNQRIHLPPDRQQWPDIDLIRAANLVRRVG